MNEVVHILVDGLLRLLAVGSVAAVVLVVLAFVLLKVGRIRTPVYRHMLWLYCLLGIIGLPLIWLCGPKLTLAILPAAGETYAGVALPEGNPGMEEPIADAGLTPADPLTSSAAAAGRESVAFWRMAAAGVWFIGFSIMLARLTIAWLHLRRICRSATPLQVSECRVALAGRKLRVCETPQLSGPVCFGVLHPIVLLPRDIVRADNGEDLRMVLAHELAHIDRRDCWANLLQRLVEAAYFFHPLVWLASRQLTQEREEICDNHVLAEGVSADDYTTLLSHLGAQAIHTPYLQTVALFEGQLLARIRSLMDPSRSHRTRLPWRVAVTCTAAVVAAFLVLGSVRLAAQPDSRATGSAPQNAAQPPAADGEGSEQPRFAARTLNSEVAFRVWIEETSSPLAYKQIGRTPSATALKIPAGYAWFVQPSTPVKDWGLLVREINQKKVPGLLFVRSATDSDLQHLAQLTELQYLDLSLNPQVTDASLEHLKGLTELTELRLSETPITDAGLGHLKGMSRLRSLVLDWTKVAGSGLEHLKGMTGLQELDLSFTEVTDAGLEHIGGLTGLQDLLLRRTQVTDAGLEHLKGMSHLGFLELDSTEVTDRGLEHLKGLTELHTLDLTGTQITDAGLEHLKGMSRLRSLGLAGTKVSSLGLGYLKGLTAMQELDLDNTQVTDAGLEHLKGMTDLRELRLGATSVTNAGLEHVKKLTRLQQLSLTGTRITDAGLEHLKGMTRLQRLTLRRTSITDAGLEHLKGMTALQQLDLSNTHVTDAGVAKLQQSLPDLSVTR
jgi:internalin A